ncbi:Transmembrane protein 74 [Dissostichus eleginoides]|uniref:Transmembrane protein 74 n=1 Tax=Dissostichus eleginoides TaxID=100907 RepID=A0AAD9C635_DISEL|nr:Transmembrane protein 74 [Dissostichus eleginoides]
MELLPADERGKQRDPPDVLDRVSGALLHARKSGGSTGGGGYPGEGVCNPARGSHARSHSAPRTAPRRGGAEVKLGHLGEEKVKPGHKSTHRPVRNGEPCSETLPEFSFMSEDDLSFGEGPGTSVDYGFISAVTFLVTGISLVIISYVVPRDVVVDRDSVSAREIERLEMESARIGAHLDRCVIAGLCLLTLGGVVLSTLLMISMWKGEMYRRKVIAYSKRSAKLYGSFSLKTRSSPSHSSVHLSLEEEIEETLA